MQTRGYTDADASVASCLHSVSLLNGQVLAKLTQIYQNISLGGGKMLIRFWCPLPHFQDHGGA